MTTTPNQKENTAPTPQENKKGIDHKAIAAHLETAAKHHHDAAKHHEEGNTQKADESVLAAKEQIKMAHEAQKNDAPAAPTA